jgi:hypothetical protein
MNVQCGNTSPVDIPPGKASMLLASLTTGFAEFDCKHLNESYIWQYTLYAMITSGSVTSEYVSLPIVNVELVIRDGVLYDAAFAEAP